MMWPEWKFQKKLRQFKTRNPMQAGFFSNSSIEDDLHAFIRECIQNSLDAHIEGGELTKVRITIGQHEHDSTVMNKYFGDEEWKHFQAGTLTCPDIGELCKFVVYEDFNTTGLVGNIEAFEPEKGNAFYFFWRAEGESGKEEGDRGRHGIGKFCIPYLSAIRTFIGITVRYDDKKCLIAGQSVLKSHKVDDEPYTPDAWWGNFDAEDFQLPIESPELLKTLQHDFQVTRTTEESGLSVIVPYVSQNASLDVVALNVVAEYFYPILRQNLVVELVEDGQTITINSSNLMEILARLPKTEERLLKAEPYISLAKKIVDGNIDTTIELPVPDDKLGPKWNEKYLTVEKATELKAALVDAGHSVHIKANLLVKPEAAQEYQQSHINLYLQPKPKSRSLKPIFIREGITISEDKVTNVNEYVCLAIIDDSPIATLLGDSENPAHTEWEKSAEKFKGKYKWGPTTIDFVRNSFKRILNLLSQAGEELDRNALSDIFYINLPDVEEEIAESHQTHSAQDSDNDETDSPFEDIVIDEDTRAKRRYKLTKTDNGFKIKGPQVDLESPCEYRVRVAYDTGESVKKVFNSYIPADFDLTKSYGVGTPSFSGVDNPKVKPNEIYFSAKNNDFEVVVDGFDPHRDILVDVVAEEKSHEAV